MLVQLRNGDLRAFDESRKILTLGDNMTKKELAALRKQCRHKAEIPLLIIATVMGVVISTSFSFGTNALDVTTLPDGTGFIVPAVPENIVPQAAPLPQSVVDTPATTTGSQLLCLVSSLSMSLCTFRAACVLTSLPKLQKSRSLL